MRLSTDSKSNSNVLMQRQRFLYLESGVSDRGSGSRQGSGSGPVLFSRLRSGSWSDPVIFQDLGPGPVFFQDLGPGPGPGPVLYFFKT